VLASPTQGLGAAASLVTALWTLTALTGSTYSLSKTVPGGSPVAVGTTYNTGTTYDSTAVIPGVSLTVSGGATLSVGDTLTFTTDAPMAILASVAFYTSTGSASGQYLTPILDSGRPDTQWFLYEHEEPTFANGSPTVSVTAHVSQAITSHLVAGGGPASPTPGPLPTILNANPDPTTNQGAQSYSTLVTPSSTLLPLAGVTLPESGARRNCGGVMGAPVGRYAQFVVQLQVNTQGMEAWARDLSVYYWTPSTAGNPNFLGKLGLPPNWGPGPLLQAYFGSLLTFVADTLAATYALTQSFGLAGATGAYLLAKGADLGQPHVLGEPSSAYQNRLATYLQAKNLTLPPTAIQTSGTGSLSSPLAIPGTGNVSLSPVSGEQGSVSFMTEQIAALVNGVTPTLTSTIASATGLQTVTGGGVTVSQLAGRGISISLPNPPYPGLPGLAYGTVGGVDNPAKALLKQFVLSLLPAATLFNVNSSTYLNFGVLG
jgi:hypothetical protein